MNRKLIRSYQKKQPILQQNFSKQVKSGDFVDSSGIASKKLTLKLAFLNELKSQLKLAFGFDDYQSEFVVNEAMKRVLNHTTEDILTFRDTRTSQKLVKTSFLLGHHYFKFNLSQI